jgi:protein-S-isoprenylcysteine O-methyltransferase Ste14
MYLSMAVMLTGIWILLGVLSPVLCVLLFIVAANQWYIPYEEKLLTAKFGSDYTGYKARVRRWI